MESRSPGNTLLNLVSILSEAMDLVSPLVADHHRRTAWFAVKLAREMGFPEEDVRKVLIASLLHDVGAFSLRERLDTLRFEFENPHYHASLGYQLLHDFGPLREEARIILRHHCWWRPEREGEPGGAQVPVLSHVIHLADRVAIMMGQDQDLEGWAHWVLGAITRNEGTLFMPEATGALRELLQNRDVAEGARDPQTQDREWADVAGSGLVLREGDLERLAGLFARIIDFRSHFTATHSAGVAAVSEALARILGFSLENCSTIRVAGYLHDIGKLTVPSELIEKPGPLDDLEYIHVQDHAAQTRRFLERIPELGHGIVWASQHHERLDGSGYPDHCKDREIAFGSRVVAVADIFTAVTEDRPYRDGMDKDAALRILANLTMNGYLDREVFDAVSGNFEELNAVRLEAQAEAEEDYRSRIEAPEERIPGAT